MSSSVQPITDVDLEEAATPKAPSSRLDKIADAEYFATGEDVKIPTDVDSEDQLSSIPKEYLSDDPTHPLQSADEFGHTYNHVLRPLFYSVVFILLIEALERFSYYGVAFTQELYLTGAYNSEWNANLTSVEASTFISTSTGLTYTMPFVGGILADVWLGDYWVIVGGVSIFYIPGLLLLALTAYPYLLGETFNLGALTASLLALYPMGAGAIKSVVNVMGAKQYHPVLQSSFIEQYYINFYLCINIGALVGGFVVPSVVKHDAFAAYMIPVCGLTLALIIFLLGTKRYILMKANGKVMINTLKTMVGSLFCWSSKTVGGGGAGEESSKRTIKPSLPGLDKLKESNGGKYDDSFVESVRRLLYVIPVSALVMPFTLVYNQLSTVFITQGEVMKPAGPFDPALMQNFDAISVIVFGLLAGRVFYPSLTKRGIYLPIATKFAIGTSFGTLAIAVILIIEYQIRKVYEATGEPISIIWQIFAYVPIGAAEIFSISAAYEAAFTISPKQNKGLASALNIFILIGVTNFIAVALYNACRSWFTNDSGTTDLSTLELYTQASVYRYWWLMLGIAIFGVLLNLFPPIKNWVEQTANASKFDTARNSLEYSRMSRNVPLSSGIDISQGDEEPSQ